MPPEKVLDTEKPSPPDQAQGTDFIRVIIEEHLRERRYGEVVTRFPPEPNGYLHIGHAKAVVINFGIAKDFGGRCHLRFDDTNPLTEEEEFAEAIQRDIRWLGYDWGEHLYHAADYFERLYEYAETLIRKGLAYVDSQSEEEIRENRGTVTEAGVESSYRSRSPEESLDLFRRMRAGECEEGEHVLRARIDMAHPNMLMRDPVLYRIRHATHYRTGDEWSIYPLYDFAHCLEDAIEGVTHSLCSLEFANNRVLYDWILDGVGIEEPRPHQYEFARLNLEYTITSKRKLMQLVKGGHVDGWDDPRMPTIAGLRRRGVPPEAVRSFCEMIGVAKADSTVDVAKFEYVVRDHLNWTAPRVLAVLDPLELVVENWPEGETQWLDAPHYPRDVGKEGSRPLPFTGRLYIEREDFAADPPKGFRRMAPGRLIRLRYGYVVECTGFETDPDSGAVRSVRCRYDPETRGGTTPDGGKVSGTIHWVSAKHSVPVEVRLYDRLFRTADPEGEDFTDNLNAESLVVKSGARIEPSVLEDDPDVRYQFERTGYFWRDPEDSGPGHVVFNRIVTLRDTWSRRRAAEDERARKREAESRPSSDSAHPVGSGGEAGEGGEGDRRNSRRPGRGFPEGAPAFPQAPEDRISDERREARRRDPELAVRLERYRDDLGLTLEDADILTGSRDLSDLFEAALETYDEPVTLAAWITNDFLREAAGRSIEALPLDGGSLGTLARMVDEDRITRLAAKDVLREMVEDGADPQEVVKRRGMEKVSDAGVLRPLVDGILEEWPGKVEEFRGGRKGLLGFFIGRAMERTEGRADPQKLRALLLERLEET